MISYFCSENLGKTNISNARKGNYYLSNLYPWAFINNFYGSSKKKKEGRKNEKVILVFHFS
jgi:hypothetical protein